MRTVWVSFDTIGRDCLQASAEVGAEIVGIVTLPGPVDPSRSGQCSFDDVASAYGAALIETGDVNSLDTLNALRRLEPELVFVVGWSQLVHDPFIAVAREGVFGMHPTLLPRHRGRAPIPWAILCGLARTGVTLFEIVDSTADSGAIVGQVTVDVAADETATTLFDRLAAAHVDLVREYVPQLVTGTAPRLPQDPSRASSWPKRVPADGIIDWETRAPYLDDWVRARARIVPLRTPAQLRQLQFHCGNPPPAAEPSTRIFIAGRPAEPLRRTSDLRGSAVLHGAAKKFRRDRARADRPEGRPARVPRIDQTGSAMRDVQRDFHAETPVDRSRFFPDHGKAP